MPSIALFLVTYLVAGAGSPVPASSCAAPADSGVVRFAAVAREAHDALATDGGRLWGTRLDSAAWLGVARVGDSVCVFATEEPRAAGYEATTAPDGLWAGPLPAGVSPANTSVELAGRRWAMVVLPLPADSATAMRLLVHEATHAAQDTARAGALPLLHYGEGGAGAELLDRPDGRAWLRLEWRALRTALLSTGGARRRATRDALTFRALRYAIAAPDERRRERALDVVEGLPEYTAWALTTPRAAAPRAFAATLARADRGAPRATLVRSFPYATGPAYAFLLDASAPGWRHRLRAAGAAADLQRALLARLDVPAPVRHALADTSARIAPGDSSALAALARRSAVRYGGDAVRAEEDARWAARERELAELRARFVDGPTLRLRPGALRISFDPRGQSSLGGAGTVMRGLAWRGDDGAELSAPAGALVTSDWSELRVPAATLPAGVLTAGPLAAPLHLEGDGWSLSLPAGWIVERDGGAWTLEPPPGR